MLAAHTQQNLTQATLGQIVNELQPNLLLLVENEAASLRFSGTDFQLKIKNKFFLSRIISVRSMKEIGNQICGFINGTFRHIGPITANINTTTNQLEIREQPAHKNVAVGFDSLLSNVVSPMQATG